MQGRFRAGTESRSGKQRAGQGQGQGRGRGRAGSGQGQNQGPGQRRAEQGRAGQGQGRGREGQGRLQKGTEQQSRPEQNWYRAAPATLATARAAPEVFSPVLEIQGHSVDRLAPHAVLLQLTPENALIDGALLQGCFPTRRLPDSIYLHAIVPH